LPHPPVEVDMTVPYSRGDLISRAHTEGEILATRHDADGTYLHALVPFALAAEMSAAQPSGSA
jgi:GTP-binding protein HflX